MVLSRRIRSQTAGAPCDSTAASWLLPRLGDAPWAPLDDADLVDTTGARHLAARLCAGVSIGTRIVLESDDVRTGLRAGDRGIVSEITPEGVVVEWDRGFSLSVDPLSTPYHALAT